VRLPGSGTGATAMKTGPLKPEMRAGFTVAPAVVYSPILLLKWFATNRSDPETAIPSGPINFEMRAGFTVAPAVVYSPIVPLLFVTKI
jgi:hypothetical protein